MDTEKEAAQKPSQKRPYEAPSVTFVALKLEERLLGCGPNSSIPGIGCIPFANWWS